MTEGSKSTMSVKQLIDAQQLKRDVSFSDNAITDAYMEQASLYVEYSQIAQQAELQADSFRQKVEIIEAKIDQEIRSEYLNRGEKLTENQLGRMLTLDKRVIGIKKRYLEAKSIAGFSKGALEAIKQKKDMLIQCGADLREESKGQLRMNGSADTADRKARAEDIFRKATG